MGEEQNRRERRPITTNMQCYFYLFYFSFFPFDFRTRQKIIKPFPPPLPILLRSPSQCGPPPPPFDGLNGTKRKGKEKENVRFCRPEMLDGEAADAGDDGQGIDGRACVRLRYG